VPLSVIETEEDRKRRKKAHLRRCHGCGGFHQVAQGSNYSGSDEDDSDAFFDFHDDEDSLL